MSTLNHTLTGPADAPVVLFLHGFMGSSADWAPIIAQLDSDYRCLAADLPGQGRSVGLDAAAYTMEGATAALTDLLDACSIAQCAVVGYSMGGRLALYFGLHRPARCRRLVLESASPGLQSAAEQEARRGVDEARAVRLEAGPLASFLDEWYRQPLFASLSNHEGLVEHMVQTRQQNDPGELARLLRGMGTGQQPSLWERLAAMHVPTLAIAGALDGKYVEIAERMAVLNTKVHTVIVPRAGHNVHAELPDVYLDVLRRFLRPL